ncbi:MAG: hypothetical protein WCS97_02425 [Candidatus Paceibacterota bacterium]|jgi:hypothetical protein
MTIAEAREKCKVQVAKIPRDVVIIGVLVLTSTLSFGLGYLAGLDTAEQGSGAPEVTSPDTSSPEVTKGTAGQIVASKNGTKYYFPSCAGVDRISETNKVWFDSESAAIAAGYTLAANCKGI